MKKDYLGRDSLRKTRKIQKSEDLSNFCSYLQKISNLSIPKSWKSSIENAKYFEYLYE